jgi:hypothetical protein
VFGLLLRIPSYRLRHSLGQSTASIPTFACTNTIFRSLSKPRFVTKVSRSDLTILCVSIRHGYIRLELVWDDRSISADRLSSVHSLDMACEGPMFLPMHREGEDGIDGILVPGLVDHGGWQWTMDESGGMEEQRSMRDSLRLTVATVNFRRPGSL